MLRHLLLAAPILALAASHASAQIRPTPVITGKLPIITLQPQINPVFASPYSLPPVLTQQPTYARQVVLPATWTPATLSPTTLTPWGIQPARLNPGIYTPPLVASVEPSRYYSVSPWAAVNPVNGNVYNGFNNTFTTRTGSYQYNPWTDTFTNPSNNATYNPYSGVTIRPLNPVPANNFYYGPQYPGAFR